MTFGRAIRTGFEKYVQFEGRATLSEFWWWALFFTIVMLAAHLVDYFVVAPALGLPAGSVRDGTPLSSIMGIALILPNVAVAARRLHDVNRSAYWLLIVFVPVLGALLLLYWFLQPSFPGKTEYSN